MEHERQAFIIRQLQLSQQRRNTGHFHGCIMCSVAICASQVYDHRKHRAVLMCVIKWTFEQSFAFLLLFPIHQNEARDGQMCVLKK